jgi:putative ABC transport system permease protein
MLYRFASAGGAAAIARDRAAVAALAPRGSLTGAQSYLVLKKNASRETATFVPFTVAFGILGLVMSVLIIGIVVSGAVSASTRRIGVLKSLGFTPAQAGRAYVGQALVPAAAGTALGVVLGNLGSVPLLAQADDAYGTASLSVAPWIDVAVPAGVLALVVASALAPALRAARMRTVEAIAIGRTPRVGRGRAAARLDGRLPVARSLRLGLASPFARPGRSVPRTPGAIAGPSTGPSPSGGPSSSAKQAAGTSATGLPPTPADPATIARVIAAQPGTRGPVRHLLHGRELRRGRRFDHRHRVRGRLVVGGVPDDLRALVHRARPGGGRQQVPGVGRRAHRRHGHRQRQRPQRTGADRRRGAGDRRRGMRVMTDAATLTGVGITVRVDEFHVDPARGTGRGAYLAGLNTALRPLGAEAVGQGGGTSSTVVAMDAMTAMLTLMLVAVAGLGVLNTVVLDTRERVHDLGVLKALGMAPRQTVAMVVTSVAGIGTVAGLIGVPAGIALHGAVLPVMGNAAGTKIPAVDLDVYHLPQIALLAVSGLVIAVAGALLPAGWAARTRTAAALRTE